MSGVDQIRARVTSDSDVSEDGDLRLIVQSYSRDSLDQGQLPSRDSQPLASLQRAITAEELRDGVDVSMLQLPELGLPAVDSVLVAWVERGIADLEFEGMEARPLNGAYYGTAQRGDLGADVILRLEHV